jgi:hypothetical protein
VHASPGLRSFIFTTILVSASALIAQTPACPRIAAHELTPAEQAYHDGHYGHAEDLFGAELLQHPNDEALVASFVQTQLRENKLAEAAARLQPALDAGQHSAVILTARAELEFRQGQPWTALQTLDTAAAADPCYARVHLIRARILRVSYMHASERAEIDAANKINPNDTDIHRAWANIVNAAEQAREIQKALAAPSVDADVKRIGEPTFTAYVHQLRERSETCHMVSNVSSATFPLSPFMRDGRTVFGYGLDVQLGARKATMMVDSGASGLYITRALADEIGLQRGENAAGNTVHLDVLRIGPLEFHDCTVGVSEEPFVGARDGFISTDIFERYLIDVDYPARKLKLTPLPALPTDPLTPEGFPADDDNAFAGDRFVAPELKDYSPVYRSKGYLLLPVMLNHKATHLFVLDTGIARTAISPDAAHEVSKARMNFTNPQPTSGGGTLQVYREPYNLQLANLSPTDAKGIVELDPTIMDHNIGFNIAGLIGFDVLHELEIHLDYRDGLVRFDSSVYGATTGGRGVDNLTAAAPAAPACGEVATGPGGRAPAIHVSLVSYIDTAQAKAGQSFFVKTTEQWIGPNCTLQPGAVIKGRILAASPARGGKTSELAILLDKADCQGHHDAALTLQVAAVINIVKEVKAIHSMVPLEVAGGAVDIGQAVGAMGNMTDANTAAADDTGLKEGDVRGMAGTTLQMTGGPACSSRLAAAAHNVRIEQGSELILELRKPQ